MEMQAGKLNRKIEIQHDTSDGTTDAVWEKFREVFANKQGLYGRTFYQAAAVNSESDIIYTIRYPKDYNDEITVGMRIIDKGNTLEIKAPPVDKDGNKQWLTICAKEVLTNGRKL